MSKKKPVNINDAEVLRTIAQRFAGADDARLDRLRALAGVTGVRLDLLERESRRLAQKHGANHPLSVEAGLRLREGAVMQRSVKHEIARASLATPASKKDAWTIFGMVRNADGSPLRDAFVVLVDEGGKKVAPDPPVTTDRDGSFQITMPAAARKAKAAKGAAGDADAAASPALHLEVFRTPTKRLAVDSMALHPEAGAVDYRDVVVGNPERDQRPRK